MSTEPNLVPGWLQVAFGAALGAAAIAAVRVDVINNYSYGLPRWNASRKPRTPLRFSN
jgi:hypothetical protein